MAVKDRLTIELYVDDQGTLKLIQARKSVEDLGKAGKQSMQEGAAGADEFAGALTRKLGVLTLVTAGLYGLGRTAVSAFKAGIQAADDYRLTTIGVAATLTDLSTKSDLRGAFSQNLAYAQGMYNELELAAARYFASGKEMTQAWNILAQKGIVLRHEEIDALGVITDRIKLSTQGQASSLQIAQEMRALVDGTVRQQSQVSMLLKDRIPDLEAQVKLHRQQGDLVLWIAEQFKGLGIATGYIENTLEAQKSTLSTLLSQVGRGGLAGAYEDIVGWLKQANEYITDHKEDIQGGIARGWLTVKELVGGVYGIISEIANLANKGIVVPIKFVSGGVIGGAAKFLAGGEEIQRLAEGAFGGTYSPEITKPAVTGAEGSFSRLADIRKSMDVLQAHYGTDKFYMLPNGDIVPMSVIADPAEVKKLGGGEDAGKGAESAQRKIENIIDGLQKEWAQLAGGSMAQTDAWGEHVRREIDRVAGFSDQKEQARTLVSQVEALKKEKIEQDFYSWVAKKSEDHYAGITDEANKRLLQVQDNAEAEKKIMEILFADLRKQRDKDRMERLGLEKSVLESLAGAVPLLSQQLALKSRILPLEAEINRLNLERKMVGLDLTDIQKDELRGIQALTEQYRKFNLEMERNQGLMGWAWSRAKEADTQSTIKELMGSLESGFQNAFSSGLQGVLAQDKKTLQKIGQTMFQGFLGEITKASIKKVFGSLAQMLRPEGPEAAGATAGGSNLGGQLAQAAQGLKEAGVGFDANAAQFGLAAGGLLLSSIGIMTNSQALVYAGMVLQIAGMAIQMYQALTAVQHTGAAVALTGSAGALTAAAFQLTMAAWRLTFFHEGGVVAHQGLIVAHNGWPLAGDERLILAQTGEGVLPRSSMARLGSAGFEALRSGKFEAGKVSGGGQAVVLNGDINITVPVNERFDGPHAEQIVRRHLIPAIEKKLKTEGYTLRK